MARRRKRKYSRLTSRERKRYARQTAVFTLLTILLIIAIVVWGIPSLVKVAVFLGDLRSSSQPISGEDTIPPPPPILQPPPDATSSPTIRLEGFAEDGSTVVISINNSTVAETLVETDGEFLFNTVRLEGGENRITARAVDPAGNESQPSAAQRVRYDANPPELEVFTPTDGSKYFGSGERVVQVSGIAEKGSTVLVNDNLVILGQDGGFSYPLTLQDGENEITVIARDRAGNENVSRIRVFYEE